MAGGRPTDYSDEKATKARLYLECYEDEGHVVPSIAGLALYLEQGRRTLYSWGEAHEEFQHILEAIGAKQEQEALSKGLKGDWNATIVKLLLGKHGYSDKQEHDHASRDGTMTPKGLDTSNLSTSALKELMNARASSDTE